MPDSRHRLFLYPKAMMTPSIPEIKQRLYAMRNGVIADSLRNAGSPYRSIFGLNLPQLTEIA